MGCVRGCIAGCVKRCVGRCTGDCVATAPRIVTFRGRGGERVRVQLRVPDAGAECAITLDAIATSEVDGFEGLRIDEQRPALQAAQLPCGHEFAANALAVYWLTDAMRCPLCRKGVDAQLALASFPPRWHNKLGAHVERRERDNEVELALQAYGSGFVQHHVLNLDMVVAVLDAQSRQVEEQHVMFNPTPQAVAGVLQLRVSRACVRRLSLAVERNNATSVRMTVYMRTLTPHTRSQPVLVADSGNVTLPRVVWEQHQTQLQPAAAEGLTEVSVVQQVGTERADRSGTEPAAEERSCAFTLRWVTHSSIASLRTVAGVGFDIPVEHVVMLAGDSVADALQAAW